jgi:hypothetical protein
LVIKRNNFAQRRKERKTNKRCNNLIGYTEGFLLRDAMGITLIEVQREVHEID